MKLKKLKKNGVNDCLSVCLFEFEFEFKQSSFAELLVALVGDR